MKDKKQIFLKKYKDRDAITLVSIIITIVILLILTGVAISTLQKSGLFEKTQEAIEGSKKAVLKEQAVLAINEIQLKKQKEAPNNTVTEYVKNKGEEGVEVTDNGLVYFEEEEYFFVDKESNVVELIEEEGNLKVGEVIGKSSSIIRKKINYNKNGGSGDIPQAYLKRVGRTVEVNFKIVPTKEGYGFIGWSTNPKSNTAEYSPTGTKTFEMPNEDVTLYAVWDVNKHTVTYNANGGDDDSVPDVVTTNYGNTVNIDFNTIPTKRGYSFIGWAKSSDGNVVYSEDKTTSFIIGDENVVLFAKWSVINYSITYNLNGGSISGERNSYTVESDNYILPTPTKNTYTFVGWTGSNGEEMQTNVEITKGTIENKTYIANWKKNYTISNLITNGSFENGSTGWNLYEASVVTSVGLTGSHSLALHIPSNTYNMSHQNIATPILNHKYYGRINYYATTAGQFSSRFEIFYNDAEGNGLMMFNNTGSGAYGNVENAYSWTAKSSIRTITTSENLDKSFVLRNFTITNNYVIYSDDLIIVDLTAAFGTGNEPNVSWCDSHIPYFDNSKVIEKIN